MQVAITGGTGYIGRHLVEALLARGDDPVVISRSPGNPWSPGRVTVVRGDPRQPGAWQDAVARADGVVNLAGAPIVEPPKRWTKRRKDLLWESRVATTLNVVAAIRDAARPPRVLVSGSAIGYYGPRGDDDVDERASAGQDFLGRLASAWEAAAGEAAGATRLTVVRTGLVLGPASPFLQPMVPLFRLGLGFWWGDGSQWLSWVHIADEIGMILHLLDREGLAGPFNLTAPHPVTVKEFAKTLGRAVHRPVWLPVPALPLRLALGEAADALLSLQRVIPRRAIETGYAFRFPRIEEALHAALA